MKLITHNGKFHYDEVLATAVLLKLYPDAEVVRTRDADVIATGDIVYDVGRVYDAATHRYDHHQNTFTDCFSPDYSIRLSSAGLVFKHFHVQLFEQYGLTAAAPIFDDIVTKVYREFFLPADAIDNGYDCVFSEVRVRSVADSVANFNSDDESKQDERFRDALSFVRTDLDNYLDNVLRIYTASYTAAYNLLKGFTGDIVEVADPKITTAALYELNERMHKGLKYIVFVGRDEYRILTIPKVIGKFDIKYPLHPKWRGLSGKELDDVSGIPGCVFVHATGFTGGNKTLEGAMRMCRESLKQMDCE